MKSIKQEIIDGYGDNFLKNYKSLRDNLRLTNKNINIDSDMNKKKLYKRENYLSKIRGFYHANDLIKVITGVRRCGKSSILQMVVQELLEEGVKERQIVFIDLEKRGYKKIRTPDALEELIDEKFKGVKETKYLFIDEIQKVKGFEEIVNAFRAEDDYSIFITGSNSYLLSGELMTLLTGRYLEFEIFPLTYEEYIGMKKFYKMPIDEIPQRELDKYIIQGGFPRTLFFDSDEERRAYIQGLVDEIYKKDIKLSIW